MILISKIVSSHAYVIYIKIHSSVDWFEDSAFLLFNPLPVTELLETSGKETPKLSCQVTRTTAGIKTLSHHCDGGPKRKNAGWASLLYILGLIQGWRTVAFVVPCWPL